MNIAGGPYLGGNFWVSPEGDGFSQTASDEDGDMIADLPFNITETNYDYLSLVFGKISEKKPKVRKGTVAIIQSKPG